MKFNNYQFNGYLRGIFSITTVMGRKESITDLHSFFLQYNNTLDNKLDLVDRTAQNEGINIYQELIQWSKEYDINNSKKVINPSIIDLLELGLKNQRLQLNNSDLDNPDIIKVIDFYITKTYSTPTEQYYKKQLSLIHLIYSNSPDYEKQIPNVLNAYNKKFVFDKDRQKTVKDYLNSFSINLVEKYPELKQYYKSLETVQYLKSEELLHYRMDIDTNVIANINDVKTNVALVKTIAALTNFLKLIDNKEIFNYLGKEFSMPTYKKNKFDQSSNDIQIDFLFENEFSKNIFKEVLVSFVDYVVENLEQPNSFTKDNITSLVDKWCMEKCIDNTKKEFKSSNNKIKM